jgi:hypothetical protein
MRSAFSRLETNFSLFVSNSQSFDCSLIKAYMESAGKDFFANITSAKFVFADSPKWFQKEPIQLLPVPQSDGGVYQKEYYYWSTYWWYVILWLVDNVYEAGITIPFVCSGRSLLEYPGQNLLEYPERMQLDLIEQKNVDQKLLALFDGKVRFWPDMEILINRDGNPRLSDRDYLDLWRCIAKVSAETCSFLDELLSPQLSQFPLQNHISSSPPESSPLKRALASRFQNAYDSYEYGSRQSDSLKDKDVYDWLKENGYELETGKKYNLPKHYEIWSRYVREGRKFYHTQKNTSRYGRMGGSIVRTDQTEL